MELTLFVRVPIWSWVYVSCLYEKTTNLLGHDASYKHNGVSTIE